MALKIGIDTEFGMQATYHKVGEIVWANGQVKVRVYSYSSKTARDGGSSPLGKSDVTVGLIDLENPWHSQIYAMLKGFDNFKDAEDC